MPPWERYQQAAPQADPVIAHDPYKAEDQQMQRDAAARAQQSQDRQQQQFEATQAREAQRDARAATKDSQGQEFQAKSAAFYGRMLQAEQDYSGIGGDKIGPRGVLRQQIHDQAPNVENSYLNDPARQQADQAARNFIAAQLRLESGAAISAGEYDNQYRIFFPQPGDSKEVIAQKAAARKQAVGAMALSSGPLAEKAAATVQPSQTEQPQTTQGGQPPEDARKASVALWGQEVNDANGKPLGPDGGQGFDPSGKPLGLFNSVTDTSSADRPTSFVQGVGEGLAQAGGNAAVGMERLTGIENIGDLLGVPTAADMVRGNVKQAVAQSPYQGSTAGKITGNVLGTLPAGLVGSPALGGAIAGGLMTDNPDNPSDIAKNALLGAAGGKIADVGMRAAGRGLNALMPRAGGAVPDMEVVGAGARQRIPIRQPDARPELRGRYAAAESTQHGGPGIRAAREADNAAIEARVAEVGGPGTASDQYALGSRVQAAGQRYIARTRQQANRLYDRARQEAGDATVTPRNADAALDTHIREFEAAGGNSNAAAIRYLQGLREDIDRGLSLSSVQNLRTNMRGQLGERGLTGTDTERRVSQVLDAMNQDLTEQLPQSASTALRAADAFYRQRQEFITGTLKQFMGSRGNPLPAETAASRLVSMSQGKGNFERFGNMWRELEPGEQADAAATIAASLGRRQNGDFSPAILIKSLDPRNGINPRTARLVFGDDGARALEDLRVIARAKGEALNRQSPSGQSIVSQAAGLKTLLMGALGFGTAGPGGAAAGAVSRELFSRWGEQRAARMLLNPDFTRWLRNAPNSTNPSVINRYFARLGASSVAVNDNQAFVTAIREMATNSPGRAAADDKANSRREPPK